MERDIMLASYHSHLLADFGLKEGEVPEREAYWRWRNGFKQRDNLAYEATKTLSREAAKVGANKWIYAITSDENGIRDRFRVFRKWAENCRERGFEKQRIGENAFVVRYLGFEVFYINSQSVKVNWPDGRDGEHLVIGANDMPAGMPFSDLTREIAKRGSELVSVAEHPSAMSIGGAGIKYFRQMCEKRSIDAAEHNAQLALGDWAMNFPYFRDFAKLGNNLVEEIARPEEITILNSDDANMWDQIARTYNTMDASDIQFTPRDIMPSIVYAIRSGRVNFPDEAIKPKKATLTQAQWFDWVGRNIILEEKLLHFKRIHTFFHRKAK